MARFSDEDIAKVREATDLVQVVSERVVLKQKGRLFWGNCPFHGEKTPSFKIDPGTGLWHCFGCGKGGDVFKYIQYSDNMDFPEAVRMLAERAHIEVSLDAEDAKRAGISQQVRAVCKDTAEFYHSILKASVSPAAATARSYLASRGFGSEIAQEWMLGFAPGHGQLAAHLKEQGHSVEAMVDANVVFKPDRGPLRDRFYDRVMFPICDVQGRPIAFGGRIIGDGAPKYLNSNDTPVFHKSANLYGLDKAKNSIVTSRTAIVVEGYTDVIALHKAGFTNVVATLGTALTARHVTLLGRFAGRIVYVFDGDEAGLKAADRAVEFIDQTITPESSSNPVMLDVVTIPAGADPADLVSQTDGVAQFQKLLDTAQSLIKFAIDRRLARWNLDRPEERQKAISDCASVLAPIKKSMMATDYAQYIVDKLWAAGLRVDLKQVLQAIEHSKVAPSAPVAAQTSPQTVEEKPVLSVTMSADDAIEREVLALMIASARARGELKAALRPEVFANMAHRELYNQIIAIPDEVNSAAVVSLLEKDMQGVAQGFAAWDFEELENSAVELTAHLSNRVVINYLERIERKQRMELKEVTDKARKQELSQSIVGILQKIAELRSKMV